MHGIYTDRGTDKRTEAKQRVTADEPTERSGTVNAFIPTHIHESYMGACIYSCIPLLSLHLRMDISVAAVAVKLQVAAVAIAIKVAQVVLDSCESCVLASSSQ